MPPIMAGSVWDRGVGGMTKIRRERESEWKDEGTEGGPLSNQLSHATQITVLL